jgi:hypothetical protein
MGERVPGLVTTALRDLARRPGPAYRAAAVATLVNTVPDVLRQVAVWDSPSRGAALLVDVVGFLTGLVAQLWVTGALAGSWRGALGRGTALALAAVRSAPGAVLLGVVVGGGISALITLPVSVAALGFGAVLGPLGAPPVGAFVVATLSDVVASWLTLPVLASVLVTAGVRAGRGAGRSGR